MAAGRRSTWLLAIFIVFGVLVLQATCWLVSLAVAYKMVEKSGQVHKGMTVAQVEQVLGPPVPNSATQGTTSSNAERIYKESFGTQVIVDYQNGVADFILNQDGIDLWSPNIAVIGFNVWCLLTVIPLIAYRGASEPARRVSIPEAVCDSAVFNVANVHEHDSDRVRCQCVRPAGQVPDRGLAVRFADHFDWRRLDR